MDDLVGRDLCQETGHAVQGDLCYGPGDRVGVLLSLGLIQVWKSIHCGIELKNRLLIPRRPVGPYAWRWPVNRVRESGPV